MTGDLCKGQKNSCTMLYHDGQEGELTLEGFLALHQMEAEDNQGKEYQLTLQLTLPVLWNGFDFFYPNPGVLLKGTQA
jgi:hypothetical protein